MRKMNCKLYENQALQFFKSGHRYHDYLIDGLVEEVKEVMDAETSTDLADESGDVLWYVTVIAHSKGYSLDEVMMRNINKLEMRELRGKKNA
jgi:NTP pyrophosphatase (non-canonical NTP hydrolase)